MSDPRISRFGQIKIYIGKCYRLFINEKQWKFIVSAFVIMILISVVTSENMFQDYADTRKSSFAVICACIWVGIFNSIQSICRERQIIKREHRAGLHISSYILAHGIYELALCSVECVIITGMVLIKNASHLPESGIVTFMALDMFITFLLIIYSSDTLAMLVSCIVKTENEAMTVMPFVLIVQLIMSGMLFELSGVTEVISYFTVSRWGLNGITAIANTSAKVKMQYNFAGDEGCDPTVSGLLGNWGVLAFYIVLYLFLAILFLKRVDKDKR